MKQRLLMLDTSTHEVPKKSLTRFSLFLTSWLLLPFFVLLLGHSASAQIAYTEGFESGIGGWSTNWANTTSLVCNGTNSPRKNIYTTGTQGNFLSPLIGTSNGGVITLSFAYKVTDWSAGTVATPATFGTINVQYSASASGPWTTVHTINSLNHTPSTNCATVNVGSFTPPPGNFYMQFECLYGTGDYWMYFDDVSISQGLPPACVQPSNLTATSITSSGATLGWTENGTATSWQVEYGLLGFTPGTGTVVTAGNNPYGLTGLPAANATYSYYVRSNCGVNGNSVWSGPFSFTTLCGSQLSGAVTIDKNSPASATNFTSFTALASELNACGIGGAVTVTVAANSGPYDERFLLTSITGSSNANTITINGNGNLLTFEATATGDRGTMVLDGTDHVSVSNLMVEARGTSFGVALQLTNSADSNTFNNCQFMVPTSVTTSLVYCVSVSGSLTGATTSGASGNYNTFSNNTMMGGYYGFTITGASTASPGLGNMSMNNTIVDFYLYGHYLTNQEDAVISGNDISRITRSVLSTFYGIYMTGNFAGTLVDGNKIHDNATLNPTASMSSYPLYTSSGAGTLAKPMRIQNNGIYNITGNGLTYGAYLLSNSFYIEFYHNTVILDNNDQTGTSTIAALYHTGLGTGLDLKNNIFYVQNTGTGTKYGIWFSNASSAHTSNYNDIVVIPSGGTPITARLGTANYATLGDWQLANSNAYDQNSSALNPVFANPAAGLIAPLNGTMNNLGTPLGVTTDIYGATRNATTPDFGAAEFTGVTNDIALVAGQLKRELCYSTNDSVLLTISNFIGGTVDFSTTPLTATWSVTGPTNSNGTITVNTGTLAAGASMMIKANGVAMPSGGTYVLNAYIGSNAANLSALNDTLLPVSFEVNKLLAALPTMTTVSNSVDTVELQAFSGFFPSAGFFITEIAHFKTTTGQPTGGWPSYLASDDYIEITGAPFSDLGGITLEQWSTTALLNTHTFPSGTVLGPNGTAVICVGQASGSPSPSDYYYFGNTSTSFGSGTAAGRILKDGLGNIIDAVGYSSYSFPASANVSASDWSNTISGGSGSSGIRLEGADVNSGTNWVLSATSPQNPNAVNTSVTVPAAPPVPGFSWTLNGATVDTNTSFWAGPFASSGTYKYIAQYNSAACGMIYDTATIVVDLPCGFTVDMTDAFNDGWNGAVVTFEQNGVVLDSVGQNFLSGGTATANVGLFDMDSVTIVLKSAGSYPEEIGFTVKNPQGILLFSHTPATGLVTGHVFGTEYAQCNVPSCPITDVPAAAAKTSCGPNPVTFTATGSTRPNDQGYFWMRSSDSAIVALGDQFTTPPITANTSWLLGIGAIDDSQAQLPGAIPVTGTVGGFGNFTNGMFFTALDNFYLDSMTVRANGPLSFIIRIYEPIAAGAGNLITISDTFTISGAGDWQINPDMAFTTGNYFMNMSVIPGSGTGALYRTTAMPAGVTFPIVTPGVVSITGPNFGTPRFYYFFDWRVSKVCVSTFATANAIFAPVPSTSLPYAENFNAGLPCNWSSSTTGAAWTYTTGYGSSSSSLNGSAFMILDDDEVGSSVLTEASLNTPVFSTLGYDSLWIEFDQYYRHITGTSGNVEVWDGTQWVNVYTVNSTAGAWSNANHQAIDITAYQNLDMQVRFRYADGGAWGWYWSIDNFELDGIQSPCQNVVVNITTDIYGSECTWSIVDTVNNVTYASGGPYADVSPYNAALATHIDTICIPSNGWYEFRIEDSYGDGLFDGTNTGTYNAYIICPWGNNTISMGSGANTYGNSTNPPSYDSAVFQMTCLLNCPVPTALAATVTCTGADLSWTSDSAAVSTLEWGVSGFTPGAGTMVNNAASPLGLSNLMPGTTYSFYVADSCWSGSVSGWAGPFDFTTDSISDPSNLVALPSCTNASLSWTSAANSSSSTVEWGATGFTPGTGTVVNNASSPLVISGLTVGSTYDFYVVDSCGTGSSNVVGPITFTTTASPAVSGSANLVSTGNTVTYDFTATGSALIYGWDFGDGGTDTGAVVTHVYVANGNYTVVVAGYNNCGVSYDTLSALVEGIGLDEFGFGNIGLYPNPNDGHFMLTGLTAFGSNATLDIVNLAGAVVYTEKLVANGSENHSVDLRGLPAGVYQVRVSSEHGTGTKPFVIH